MRVPIGSGARAAPGLVITLLSVLLAVNSACVAAAEAAPLTVCLLSHNAPYSTRADERGFDLDTARAVAARLARPHEFVWTDNKTQND